MGVGGTWMAYSMMADAVMMSTMMRHQGYYHPGMNSGVVVHTGMGFFTIMLLVIGGIVVLGFVVMLIRRLGDL